MVSRGENRHPIGPQVLGIFSQPRRVFKVTRKFQKIRIPRMIEI